MLKLNEKRILLLNKTEISKILHVAIQILFSNFSHHLPLAELVINCNLRGLTILRMAGVIRGIFRTKICARGKDREGSKIDVELF